ERFGPIVLGVCRRVLRNPSDVEDAFQATFLVFVRRAPALRDRALLGDWLYGGAHPGATPARMDAGRREERDRGAGQPSTIDEFGAAEHAEALAMLDDEVARLPEKFRAPLVLCYFEGRTHEEAARRLAWPVGTVRSRMARARDLLRARLTRRG